MITRIPQPELWGPAPAEAQFQQQQVGLKMADLLSQGIQEGVKNYQAQKQLQEQAKYRESLVATAQQQRQTESDKLKYGLMAQDLTNDLKTNGPMSYVDRKPEWLSLYGFLAGGDKELAQSMYEGGARGLNQMSASDLARGGLFNINYGQTQPQGGAVPQAGGPAGGPASVLPSATSQMPAVAPSTQLVHPLPETAAEMTPELTQQIAGNQALMDAFRAQYKGNPKVLPHGTPGQNAKFLTNNRDAFLKFVQGMNPQTMSGLVGTTTQGTMQITEMTKGLPQTAQTKTATEALQAIATGDPSATISPKQQAALKQVTNATVKVVLDSPEVKKWLEAGGSASYLQAKAASLQEALQDPQFNDFFQKHVTMAKEDTKDFLNYVKQDDKAAATATALHQKDRALDQKDAALKTAAANYLLARSVSEQRLSALRTNATTAEGRLALQRVEDVGKLADSMAAHYVAAANNVRNSFKKGTGDDVINAAIAQASGDPTTPVGQTLQRAAQLTLAYRQALGDSEATLDSVEAEIKGGMILGIIPNPMQPPSSVTIPTISGGGGGAKAQAAPMPTPAARPQATPSGAQATATPQQRMSTQDLINSAMQGK